MTGSVLQLVGPSTGGIRRHVAALAADLTSSGWTVVVAAPAGVLEGATPIEVPTGTSWWALRRARRRLEQIIEEVRPDVVHAHGLTAGWVAMGVAPARTVLTVHNVVLDRGIRGMVLRRLEQIVVGRAAVTIATSREVADRVRRDRRRVEVIEPVHQVATPTATPDEVRRRLGVAGPLVVSVARLHPQKGLDVLVRAMSIVSEAGCGAVAVVAGDGPERQALDDDCDRLGVADRVRFVGAADDAVDLMAAADVVVISSVWESGPLTLLEAGAVAAPVVTTPVGFVPEVVEPTAAAVVVPVGDAGAMAAAIMDLVDQPDAARAMGIRLRDAVGPRLDRTERLGVVESIYADVAGGS